MFKDKKKVILVALVSIVLVAAAITAGFFLRKGRGAVDPEGGQGDTGARTEGSMPDDSQSGDRLISGSGSTPSGYLLLSAASPPSLDGFLQDSGPLIGAPGVDFPLLKTAEADDWGSMPIPAINPLGSKSLYGRVNHSKAGSGHIDMSYLEGYREVLHRIYGESWTLRIQDPDLTTRYLRWYAVELGATLYENADDRVTFSVIIDKELWWAMATWSQPDSGDAQLQVVRQNLLPAGETLTLMESDMENGYFSFSTHADGNAFLTAIVEMKGGEARTQVNLQGNQFTRTGQLTRRFLYSKSMVYGDVRKYALNDIPQTEMPVYWRMQWPKDRKLESITIRFEQSGELEPVHLTDSFGSLKVVGTVGNTKVSNQSAISVLEHADGFSWTGVPDADENLVFVLPAGYYNVHTSVPGGGSGGVRMVPVRGGETTVLTLPEEFRATYAAMESFLGGFETNSGSISILNNRDLGDIAEVAILVNDPLKRDIFPEVHQISITEGGNAGEILEIERQMAPVNLVLVFDTSGSMRPYMTPAVNAAKRFVEGLPDSTGIRLLSFEQRLTEHSGTDRNAVLQSLDKLVARGDTSLYDATSKALSMLQGMENAYVVVFSDGADSREPGVGGTGSSLTHAKLIEQIEATDVSVLTIGFSEGHDPSALIAMGEANGKGAYFAAEQEDLLDQAFSAVSAKFGNQFIITYKRPVALVDVRSEEPVISVMIDDSGSMGPLREGVISLFYDFFGGLSKGSLIQFSKFGTYVDLMHITTDQRAPLLQAMGEKGDTGSNTKVLVALRTAVEQIKPLPTDKRVFIFLCDEAMAEVTQSRTLPQAERIFQAFREEGVRTLFIGVAGAAKVEASYAYAAEQTGGEFLITDDVAEIEKKLQELLGRVAVPMLKTPQLPFSIGVNARTDDGSVMDYFAAKNLEGFSLKASAGEMKEPKAPRILTGGKMIPLLDARTAARVGGLKSSETESTITTARISYQESPQETMPEATEVMGYGKSGQNELIRITVKEAMLFDQLGGVTPQKDSQFVALDVEVAFHDEAAPQTAYLVPSIMRHFYLSLNTGQPVPASKATWLTALPLAEPGSVKVSIGRGETISGLLVFHTAKPDFVKQLGLHFYDTVHGHIQIPLAGKIQDPMMDVTALPMRAPSKLSDAFSMSIFGKSDERVYGDYVPVDPGSSKGAEAVKNTVLRVVEARFDSQVQALMKLDPQQRFFYAIDTEHGPLMTRMNSLVHHIPLGFTGETMVAPGASNAVVMPYEMPVALESASSWIYGDIKGSAVTMPVTTGVPAAAKSSGHQFSHDYFDLTVHSLAPHPFSNRLIVLDITVKDKADGMGTGKLHTAFALEKRNETNEKKKYLEAVDKELLYGIDANWAVFDGASRRGILLFDVENPLNDYVLRSPHLPDMALEIEGEAYVHPELLAERHEVPMDDTFTQALDKAVSAAVTRYQTGRARMESEDKTVVLSDAEPEGTMVSAPDSMLFGVKVLASLRTEADFLHLMYAISWRPAVRNEYFYAPESVLTQEWGTQWDMAILGERILTRLGFQVRHRELTLTDRGREAIGHFSGMKDLGGIKSLPGLSYVNADGESRLFVLPFMRDASELSGLVYLSGNQSGKAPVPAKVTLEVAAMVEGVAGRSGLGQNSMFEAFSQTSSGGERTGKTETREEILLSQVLLIPALGLGPLDIGYYAAAVSPEGADVIKTVVETTDGTLQGKGAVDTGVDELKAVVVRLNFSGTEVQDYTHTTWLEKTQAVTDVCHTLAFALPEMSGKARTMMEQESALVAQTADAATSNASKVKWYARSTLYRFIAERTQHDRELSDQLDLVMGRVSHPVALVLTTRSDGKNALATMNLVHHKNQVLQGEPVAANAYRLISGMHASILEGSAVPDGSGVGIAELWQTLPPGTGFILVEDIPEARTKALEAMRGTYPGQLLKNIEQALEKRSNTVFYVPKAPGSYHGEARWAWLEFDSKTYDAISVFDTGERAGLAGYAMGLMNSNAMHAHIGFFVGVNCAVWSISAYSLELADSQEIKDAASMLCELILERIEEVLGVATSSGASDYFTGQLKGNAKIGGVSLGKAESFLSGDVMKMGFADGFKAAMKIFFDN